MKSEKDFTNLFSQWLFFYKEKFISCAFELKNTKTDKFFFSSIRDHQINSLLACGNQGLVYKIQDIGGNLKPFDMFYINSPKNYVVICFIDFFCGIDIKTIQKLKEEGRVSITADEALTISYFYSFLRTKESIFNS